MFKKNNTLNWYQDCICFLKIGIKMLICLFNWYQDFVYFHWYQLIYFFQLVSMKIYIDLFDITPLLILCFEQKGGEECFVFTWIPLLMIDKKGEKYLSLYACFVFIY